MSKMISKMNLILAVQQLPKEDVEIVQGYVEMLEDENQELKKQLEVGEQQYNDVVEEKENLQEQLDYLRSGEYLKQLRFERDMLQHVVDTNGVPSEVYDYLDCTHRNTELLEENQELKKQLEIVRKKYEFETKNRDKVYKMLRRKDGQQKDFIEWLEDKLVVLNNIVATEEYEDNRHHALIRRTAFEEILSKYKEIIGIKNE